ncbi:MAG TPA: alcohol dehydrogenase catalytic domain-containing protein [Firmicutes bacterium]|nr:alcohol dehydrogenase catalytic domain-containing protein [Bacillota bacterium]
MTNIGIPERLPGQVLLRTIWAGICGSDLHAFRGNQPFLIYPRVLGHELALEVVEGRSRRTES